MSKKVTLGYSSISKTLKFGCKSEEVLPAYLHYLLEYQKIPQDTKIIFDDITVRLVKDRSEYKYERIEQHDN